MCSRLWLRSVSENKKRIKVVLLCCCNLKNKRNSQYKPLKKMGLKMLLSARGLVLIFLAIVVGGGGRSRFVDGQIVAEKIPLGELEIFFLCFLLSPTCRRQLSTLSTAPHTYRKFFEWRKMPTKQKFAHFFLLSLGFILSCVTWLLVYFPIRK